ncbi:MAG: 16S rRNA (cytosine(1402)-N(4))-methyltransferase RsmH [Tissierellia bacterium]|nr:16S rRNA (cytosine(1402)-N(4))-methyltransferase RsmH [Tissierellia bacterium]
MEFEHRPVLYREVLEKLNIKPEGIYVDGTLGGGGHSAGILKALTTGKLIGIDQDEEALKAAEKKLSQISDGYQLIHGNFREMDRLVREGGHPAVDGILLDIGVSSYQFDNEERGFSYRYNAPLDMRMDQSQPTTARDLVNNYSEDELTKILLQYGEERWARRISKFIVERRAVAPIETTFDLVEVIQQAIPKAARRKGGHPAKKTFQALRIEVNGELEVLEEVIPKAVDLLKPGGRLAIITFHSLEDRRVKQAFRELYADCICPPSQPVCTCNKVREIEIITRKPILPSEEELKENRRAHSAKLRVAEKTQRE